MGLQFSLKFEYIFCLFFCNFCLVSDSDGEIPVVAGPSHTAGNVDDSNGSIVNRNDEVPVVPVDDRGVGAQVVPVLGN